MLPFPGLYCPFGLFIVFGGYTVKNFHYRYNPLPTTPHVWQVTVAMLELSLMLILICAIVERTITGRRGKFKALVMKQKSLQLGWKEKNFSKPSGKGDKWTILCIRGENQAADLNFGKKLASRFSCFETALSSLDSVYRKL